MKTEQEKITESGRRNLKIYSKHLRKARGFKVSPEIRLCGDWLQQMGFFVGEEIEVQFENERILITKVAERLLIL